MLRSVLAFVLAIALPLASAAEDMPGDPNRLRIEDASGKTIAVFTVQQLQSDFEQQTYDTRTPWTHEHETIVYRGPLLESVLKRTGLANAADLKIIAYDDFVSEIHMDEIRSYKPILAIERKCSDKDGSTCSPGKDFRPISMTEKGPIFIVWPFDQLPASYVPARNSIWVFFPVILRSAQ
ncbi:MAG: hypothetical protein EOR73_14240 [Mesorhizobium sp.]|uniref:hypothetical protein n=1 Tax=Mesorhizobium sp. TaxID=1871066 RepID=UPI000FE82787|nr:hypothetical protein [Mesorhizobium sp.]RWJ01255.1 MAG: hypothetical protein EOR23_25470 [Mesorhizobium sp.]RWM20600.1 MAG: hypothetical protein EOR73_14240 [Mesorhizobium sp.]TIP95588.1 MAG: hypothetical protein E5X58_02060 [Mesorhizobium sp.]